MENIKIPNFFYDLIVFMTPSLTLTIGIILGLGDFGFKLIVKNLELIKIEGLDIIMLFIFFFLLFLFLAYLSAL